MTFPHIRAPWLRWKVRRRAADRHHAVALGARFDSMRDADEAMQAEANGLDFALLVQRVEQRYRIWRLPSCAGHRATSLRSRVRSTGLRWLWSVSRSGV